MRVKYVEAVLEVVERIPFGAVLSYGDVAELLGAGGARQVGTAMSRYGSTVPWWRVLRAGGYAPKGLEAEALAHYLQEGTPLRGDYLRFAESGEGRWRVDLAAARWAPSEADFDALDSIAEHLETSVRKLSVANDGMTE
ncbi:MGMT family protein [Arthrobacter sp. D1-17]